MTEFACDHMFRTTLPATKFEALVQKACRSPFQIELSGHDPGVVPQLRLFTVDFMNPEDRDRVRIAMRFVEKEELAAKSAYEMAATVEFGAEAKQGLLDLRSEAKRIKLVGQLLRATVKRLEFVERAQVRAASNGRVRFG